jgi:hypothetical protein
MPTLAEHARNPTLLPALIEHAQKRKTIPYGELGRLTGISAYYVLPGVLGVIGDGCGRLPLPFINLLVVGGKESDHAGRPGDAGLEYLGVEEDWPEGTKREVWEKECRRVFRRRNWDALLEELRVPRRRKSLRTLNAEGREHSRRVERRGGGRESDAHKALKEWVARNPGPLGITSDGRGEQEFDFLSGDRCDVVFEAARPHPAVAEVKVVSATGNDSRGELVRGVYQAVKYRALLSAERGLGHDYPVDAHLVTHWIPNDVRGLANRLRIKVHCVPREKVSRRRSQ